jgi:hypothetical protein
MGFFSIQPISSQAKQPQKVNFRGPVESEGKRMPVHLSGDWVGRETPARTEKCQLSTGANGEVHMR